MRYVALFCKKIFYLYVVIIIQLSSTFPSPLVQKRALQRVIFNSLHSISTIFSHLKAALPN